MWSHGGDVSFSSLAGTTAAEEKGKENRGKTELCFVLMISVLMISMSMLCEGCHILVTNVCFYVLFICD